MKRKKKLSKKYYGTSHVLSKDEAKFVFEGVRAAHCRLEHSDCRHGPSLAPEHAC